MGIDLGRSLLQADYNRDLRQARSVYEDKGRSQDLWSKIGGLGLQGLGTLALSSIFPPAQMALLGGLLNTAGTYVGGKYGAGKVGDYEGQFGQESINELNRQATDGLLMSSLLSGLSTGMSSYDAGIGAGLEKVGKTSEEVVKSKLGSIIDPLKENKGLLHSGHNINLAGPASEWDIGNLNKLWAKMPDESMTHLGNLPAGQTVVEWQAANPDAKLMYQFGQGGVDDFQDYDMINEAYRLYDEGYRVGGHAQGMQWQTDYLAEMDLERAGIDPDKIIAYDPISGDPITHRQSLIMGNKEDRYNTLLELKEENELQNIYKNINELGGIDPTTLEYFDPTSPDAPKIESWGKRWQDVQNLGFWESGGFSGLFGGERSPFGLHFEDPSVNMPIWDPTLNNGQGGYVLPQGQAPMNPWAFLQQHPILSTLGIGGLLAFLGNE